MSSSGEGAVSFTAWGLPAPQGSKRAFVAGGRARVIESSHERVKSWRQAVLEAAMAAMDGRPPLDGPLSVEMIFTMPRPKGHYRTGRNAYSLRDSAPAYPARMPDLSKLARSTEDALTDAGCWADDAQVVEYVKLAKVYPGSGPGSLPRPGVMITLSPATPER